MKFGLFYQLPCAPEQSEAVRYRETVEQVIHADEIGFDVAWLAELHFFRPFSIMPAPLIVATAIAQRTRRIRLGTGVSLLPFHHPLQLAEAAATVDILSDGRLDLGVGRGTIAVHFQGYNVSREESRERFEESLEIIQQAWTTESFSLQREALPGAGDLGGAEADAEAASADSDRGQQPRNGGLRRTKGLRRTGGLANQSDAEIFRSRRAPIARPSPPRGHQAENATWQRSFSPTLPITSRAAAPSTSLR